MADALFRSQANLMNTLQTQVAAVLLASTVFFYDVGIGGKVVNLPIYLPLIAASAVFLHFRMRDIYILFYVSSLLILITVLQRVVAPAPAQAIRMTLGIILFIAMAVIGSKLWEISTLDRHRTMIKALKLFFWFHIALQACQLVVYKMTGYSFQGAYISFLPRAPGVAGEASHLPMIFAPLIFASVIKPSWFRANLGKFANMALAISVLLVAASATSFAIYAVAIFCRFLYRRSILPLVLGGPLLVAIAFSINQIEDRIMGVLMGSITDASLSDNLSVLVFLKGAEMAWAALVHHPLGVGMLNFSSLVQYSSIAALGDPIDTLNNQDGSSILFKGVGEFGYLFIVFYVFWVFRLAWVLWWRRLIDEDLLKYGFVFALCVAALRGGSYFDGPQMIGLIIAVTSIVPYATGRTVGLPSLRYQGSDIAIRDLAK